MFLPDIRILHSICAPFFNLVSAFHSTYIYLKMLFLFNSIIRYPNLKGLCLFLFMSLHVSETWDLPTFISSLLFLYSLQQNFSANCIFMTLSVLWFLLIIFLKFFSSYICSHPSTFLVKGRYDEDISRWKG